MVFGKIIAGLIGLVAGGIPGLIIGVLLGHAFDRGLQRNFGQASPENLARTREAFFTTTFLLSGYLAKADGRVSEEEIQHTEQMFVEMNLDSAQRRRAIELFRRGAAAGFSPEDAIAGFNAACGPRRRVKQTLLAFLISLAHADQTLQPAEHAALVRITGLLGLKVAHLELLLQMARAQEQFHSRAGAQRQAGSASRVSSAYAALGVDSGISDRELKRAYRKLMSEHHPDKLIARGVPEDMVKLGTERAQEIQVAYDTIRQHRGLEK